MRRLLVAGWTLLLFAPQQGARADDAPPGSPQAYDVTWTSPSRDAAGSMPLGNGAISLNAWINPAGELECYLGRTDSWGDNGRLLKVGKFRITLDPPPPVDPFVQTLSLADATLTVRYGAGDDAVTLQIWADANRPVVEATIDSARPRAAVLHAELWRTERTTLPSIEISDVLRDDPQGRPTVVEPDTVLTGLPPGRIGWYHRNVKSVGPADHARVQGTQPYHAQRPDPLLHRVFGAVATAERGQRLDDVRLQSPASSSHRFRIVVDALHPATPDEWLAVMERQLVAAEAIPDDQRRAAHEAWWRERWTRSWIVAESSNPAQSLELDDAYRVSRAYALQRFINLCGGRGAYPIKFNGGIFTVPYPDAPGDADYRRWGPGYWWQNTRLPYLSMCTSGDVDLLQPLFRLYIDDFLPLNEFRTQKYFGHGGAYFPECVMFWGDVFAESYGWTPVDQRDDPLQTSGWHKWEWVCGPELACMALDYVEHTGDEEFLAAKAIPLAHAVVAFFDEHYPLDERGKWLMSPSQALETWWDCTNPMPEVAGLTAVLDRLLALDPARTQPAQRAQWAEWRTRIPPLPTRQADGVTAYAPAERFADKRNIENPELYCVFPFRLAAFNRPNAALAAAAFDQRWDRGHAGWRQDDLFLAYLGRADATRQALVKRASTWHEGSRFPAFWGPNYDWVPDQDHGGVLLKTLQAMVLQAEPTTGSAWDGKLYVLPAWPRDWNVRFKLHAPRQTVVEGEYRDGTLVALTVDPPSRREEVVIVGEEASP